MKVSREGIILIKSFEGFRPRAVRDVDGRWIIGYRHAASAREDLTVGEQDAELLLQYDLLPVVRALNDSVAVRLNQHQFDALASFAISVGVDRFLASDVLSRFNAGRAGEAADALIGWPEATAPDAALRRRAAERALFVADPGAVVTLAQLLAAPLPAPQPQPTPAPATVSVSPRPALDARAAAVAVLLGDPTPPVAPEAPPVPEANPPATSFASEPEPVRAAPDMTVYPQRYSPYAAAIIGPLPGFPPAVTAKALPPTETAFAMPAAPAAVVENIVPASFGDAQQVAFQPEPVVPLVPLPPGPSPFPAFEEVLLVLTPATDADFVEPTRPTWPPETRDEAAPADETALFEDEPTLAVMRHEVEIAQPSRFDWSQTGAFLIMGGVGLAACAFSAAAFRLALEEPSPMGETTVLAWTLAIIGVITVGVSSWNLYVRWGKPD